MPSRLVIGVDIGGTKLAAGVVDDRLQIHQRLQRSMRGQDTPALLDTIAAAVQELVNTTRGEIAAVGFGIPSLIDRRSGTSVVAVNLPLTDIRFGALMAERLDLPVFVDNDGNVAALAEHRAGAGVGADHMVMIGLGTGIAGGLILNGELYRGWLGSGAELGHMVIDINGPRCQGNCPNHGCFESMASGTALAREARLVASVQPESALGHAVRDGREIDGPLVTELAHDGDTAAREVIQLIGERLGVAIASFVNIFNPEMVVVGGGVMGAGEMLLEPARAEVQKRALPPSRDNVLIVAAEFGAEAGMVGAAALALDGLATPREHV
ncbi:MAG TPA: ROK family protein [Solirubrobacteraceae bacterium]|nr:ROK family protein [Solirubrobacteraceae bacterium]